VVLALRVASTSSAPRDVDSDHAAVGAGVPRSTCRSVCLAMTRTLRQRGQRR